MKVVLITLYHENYQSLADTVLPNWWEYCLRHNYELLVCNRPYGPDSPIGFQKTRFVYDNLFGTENEWDIAMVLDLDIMVTNMTVKVENFIDEEHDYFVTTGFNGLCNGSYIVKKTPQGRKILEFMLANKHGRNNEQDTLKYHLDDPELVGHIKLFPYNAFCSIYLKHYPEHSDVPLQGCNWEPGDFLLHLPGRRLDWGINLFNSPEVKDKIVR